MHISNQIKAFDYMGSKFSVLPWLLPQLPSCNHYVSVFGGGGTDLLNREPSPIETYNDINGAVVNFFKVLRDSPLDLIAALELTPHSRYEYNEAWFVETDSPVEKARKWGQPNENGVVNHVEEGVEDLTPEEKRWKNWLDNN